MAVCPWASLIEAGQADLLLVSYLGADFVNKSERVYRLLGCEVTFHAELPQVGDTLHYEIHLDGYAQQGPVRLFFFHYDCFGGDRLHLLCARGAGRLLHRRRTGELQRRHLGRAHCGDCQRARASTRRPCAATRTSFTAEQVIAFSEGRVVECFGEAFQAAENHVRTPTIARGRMLMFDDVVDFRPDRRPVGPRLSACRGSSVARRVVLCRPLQE